VNDSRNLKRLTWFLFCNPLGRQSAQIGIN
jgi:hypothetical protein